MKKSMISFFLALFTFTCLAQSIDTAALGILQRSYDRLSTMENINYQIKLIDTMSRPNQFIVNRTIMKGTVKKNAYWRLHLENNAEWLVRGDTLYKKQSPDAQRITFSTDWNRHKVWAANIYNILGTTRPQLSYDIATLQFINDPSKSEFYVIQQTNKNSVYKTDESESKLTYSRYYVHKKSLLTLRRIQYGKRLESGKEAVDIYDYSVTIDSGRNTFNPKMFFNTRPIQETNSLERLEIGRLAPPIKAINVRTKTQISLEKLKGKVVVLDFWYLACAPCRELMPELQKGQEKFKKENVVFIGINVKDTDPKAIIQFLNQKRILYPQYYLTQQTLNSDYKIQAYPTTLIVGSDGKVKLVEIGVGEDTAQKLEQAIRKELKLQPNF